MAVLRPDLMMKNVVPVVMAGIIAVSHQGLSELRVGFNCHVPRSMASSSRSLFLEIVRISYQHCDSYYVLTSTSKSLPKCLSTLALSSLAPVYL
jgi:hypothetical protein